MNAYYKSVLVGVRAISLVYLAYLLTSVVPLMIGAMSGAFHGDSFFMLLISVIAPIILFFLAPVIAYISTKDVK